MATTASNPRQASQAYQLPGVLLHLTLEGGEPARRTGIKMLGGLAGLLQVPAERMGLLLDVGP